LSVKEGKGWGGKKKKGGGGGGGGMGGRGMGGGGRGTYRKGEAVQGIQSSISRRHEKRHDRHRRPFQKGSSLRADRSEGDEEEELLEGKGKQLRGEMGDGTVLGRGVNQTALRGIQLSGRRCGQFLMT